MGRWFLSIAYFVPCAAAPVLRRLGAPGVVPGRRGWSNVVVDQISAISDVLAEADVQLSAGRSAAARVWPTGFPVLDRYLAGGLRSGELTLLGGPQGLGKTSLVLQVLRHNVSIGGAAIY